jgi:hypothetical protein
MDMFRSRRRRRANGGGNVGIAGIVSVDTVVGTVSRTVDGGVYRRCEGCASDRSQQAKTGGLGAKHESAVP